MRYFLMKFLSKARAFPFRDEEQQSRWFNDLEHTLHKHIIDEKFEMKF